MANDGKQESLLPVYLAVGEDQKICENLLPNAVDSYVADGDLDAALSAFANSIHDTFSYLNVA